MNAVALSADARLEADIRAAYGRMLRATTEDDALAAWQDMRILIGRRSPEMVAQMERASGLRR